MELHEWECFGAPEETCFSVRYLDVGSVLVGVLNMGEPVSRRFGEMFWLCDKPQQLGPTWTCRDTKLTSMFGKMFVQWTVTSLSAVVGFWMFWGHFISWNLQLCKNSPLSGNQNFFGLWGWNLVWRSCVCVCVCVCVCLRTCQLAKGGVAAGVAYNKKVHHF